MLLEVKQPNNMIIHILMTHLNILQNQLINEISYLTEDGMLEAKIKRKQMVQCIFGMADRASQVILIL